MAKKSKSNGEAPTANGEPQSQATNSEAQIPTSWTAPDGTVLHFADMSTAALAYAVAYGLNKSVQDAVAGLKKELTEEKNPDGSAKYTEDEVKAQLLAAQMERVHDILAGTVGVKTRGPRLSTIDRMFATVAREQIAKAARARNVALPKVDSEHYKALYANYTAKYRDSIMAEAQRRLEAEIAAPDLGDMLVDSQGHVVQGEGQGGEANPA